MAVPLSHSERGAPRGTRVLDWLLISAIAAAIGFLLTLVVPRTVLAPIVPLPISAPPEALGTSAGVPMAISTGANVLPVALTLSARPGVLSVGGARIAGGLELNNGATYHFPDQFQQADSVMDATPLNDPILGSAQRMSARYVSQDGGVAATVDVIVADQSPALVYQSRASTSTLRRFSLPDPLASQLDLAVPVRYVTVLSSGPVQGAVALGDAGRTIPILPGTPVLLWSDVSQRGYILGLLDETSGPSGVTMSPVSSDRLGIGIASGPMVGAATTSPRLYLERIDNSDLTRALAGFRHALDVIAPGPTVPRNFRNQWGSWYVYGGNISEDRIRDQIDAITERYADVGPWQVEIDAGWSLAGGDPNGQMGEVDASKFPSGMRALVDYAHARGVGISLYGSAPWVDSRPSIPTWWVVQLGFIRDHLDWLIKVEQDDEGAAYVYDLSNPDLRAFLNGVIKRYLVEFNADGIELDMVGVIGPRGGPFRGDPIGQGQPPQPPGVAQTMEIYRSLWTAASQLKPNVWIESGYAAPALARPYVHSWK
ncbi:MAG TPA: hypothetical protein VGK54_17100, partial [Chloroflexota bacterium]